MSNDAIVIVNGARTPMGGFQGALKDVSAPDLGAAAIKAAVERAGVSADSVDEGLEYDWRGLEFTLEGGCSEQAAGQDEVRTQRAKGWKRAGV